MSILTFPTRSRASAGAGLSRLLAEWRQAWRDRRAERAMQALSDELLHDIGVARSEITEVTRHGRTSRR